MEPVKGFIRFTLSVLLFGLAVCPAQATFSSLYIFGDTVSTTTNNSFAGPLYYGKRFSNGRVWVEVLAQRQGLGANSITNVNWSYSSNNWSYYGDDSGSLVTNVSHFTAPPAASNALFVVWVNDADFVDDMGNIYPSTNIVTWTNAINLSLTNHYRAITNLYAKGVRTLVMPNAVDITEIPQYDSLIISSPATRNFIRQRVIDFNTAFTNTLMNQIRTNCPGITIYVPDFFSLLDNVLTNAAAYGLTNALSYGVSIDAVDSSLSDLSLNGPGANYIFWDDEDPTAKFHEVMADTAQQLISPVQISQLTVLNGSNRLDMANVPIGLNGLVLGSTDLTLTNWASVTNFSSTNATQSVFVTPSGPVQFYRLKFPFVWTWP
jgi:phospholipase/lecithinase/hemolysin